MTIMAQPDPTPPLTARWVETLWPDLPDGEWLSIFAADNDGDRRTLWAQTPLDVTDAVAPYIDTHNLWLGVATRTDNLGNRRGGATECSHIPALWFDLDIAGPHHSRTDYPPDEQTALELLDSFPLPPSIIVRTGGGLQPWWILDEPLDVDHAADLLEAWAHTWTSRFADAGYHLDNVFDIARVMRLPGTLNHKSDPPKPVELVDRPSGGRYGTDDLDQHLDPPPPPPTPRSTDVPYIGPQRPGDAFNAAHTGADVLEAAGWTHVRTDAEGAHYRHPTATAPTSATVYTDDGHTTIWTDSYPNLEPRRPYDPAGLYVAMHHAGDWRQATRTLSQQGYGARPITTADVQAIVAHLTAPADGRPVAADQLDAGAQPDIADWLIDWQQLWDLDRDTEQWLAEPVIARGRAHALFAAAKTGKSMLVLDIVAALAAGRPILGGPTVDPATVLYLDYEMTPEDLLDRLDDLGYTLDDADQLDRLKYVQLPMLPALNTEHGAAYILQAVDHWNIDLVVIDTTQRVVDGAENDMEPYRDLARHLGLPLKQRGVAYLRLDHAGKDRTLGQRGSSAKNDDVDVIWELRRDPGDDGQLTLKSTARMSWVPQQVTIERSIERTDHGDYTRYRLPASTVGLIAGITPNQIRALKVLEQLDLPLDISRRRAADAIAADGRPVPKTKDLGAALKWRRDHPTQSVDNPPEPVDKVVPSAGEPPREPDWYPNPGNHREPPPENPLDSGEPPREPQGTTPPPSVVPWVPPSKGGTRGPDHQNQTTIEDLIGPPESDHP